jgi:hypothetical protein
MAVPGSPLLAAGIHPRIASEPLGHSQVGITLDLYSHGLPRLQDEAAPRVDDMTRAQRALANTRQRHREP